MVYSNNWHAWERHVTAHALCALFETISIFYLCNCYFFPIICLSIACIMLIKFLVPSYLLSSSPSSHYKNSYFLSFSSFISSHLPSLGTLQHYNHDNYLFFHALYLHHQAHTNTPPPPPLPHTNPNFAHITFFADLEIAWWINKCFLQ